MNKQDYEALNRLVCEFKTRVEALIEQNPGVRVNVYFSNEVTKDTPLCTIGVSHRV